MDVVQHEDMGHEGVSWKNHAALPNPQNPSQTLFGGGSVSQVPYRSVITLYAFLTWIEPVVMEALAFILDEEAF